METTEIIEGTYNDVLDVQVKFTKIIEVPDEKIYCERDVLNTIAFLEQQKIDYCRTKDIEIAKNNEMLLKIRTIDRTNNVIE